MDGVPLTRSRVESLTQSLQTRGRDCANDALLIESLKSLECFRAVVVMMDGRTPNIGRFALMRDVATRTGGLRSSNADGIAKFTSEIVNRRGRPFTNPRLEWNGLYSWKYDEDSSVVVQYHSPLQ